MSKRNRIAWGLALTAVLLVAIFLVARGANSAQRQAERPSGTSGAVDAAPFGPRMFRDIADAQSPMVVNIRTESRRQTRDLSEFFEGGLFERFFGIPEIPPGPREQITQAAGTGFIIDESGLILTNNHVVAGATRITVALYAQEAGAEYEARVVGRDPLTDSALIELTEKPDSELPTAVFGNSDDMRPGDWVLAIGNPFNLAHTVTVGVISAINRPFPVSEGHWQDVLQTDAAINPGNSGGPLLNLRGEVIGMNTAILTGGAAVGNVGVGFAIPINAVTDLLPQLRRGTITRGRIGVQITRVTPELAEPLGLNEARGALVRLVERDGPAADAGIRPGDVIVGYNGKPVEDNNALVAMVTQTEPGATVPVEIVRDGERRTLRVAVERLELEQDGPVSGGMTSETGLGLSLQSISPQIRRQLELPAGRGGAVVARVEPGGAAARAGLQPGDVVLEVNRKPVGDAAEAAAALRAIPEGETGFVLIWRGGQELFVTISRA